MLPAWIQYGPVKARSLASCSVDRIWDGRNLLSKADVKAQVKGKSSGEVYNKGFPRLRPSPIEDLIQNCYTTP